LSKASSSSGYVFLARAIRDFGDGFVAILLPVYLIALGMSAFDVGVVATLALFGSALLTLAIGFLGARHDQRALLLAASVLMAATGLAYAAASDYTVLLLVAFVGTINPSGGSTSIFVPLEHAILSGATPAANRTNAFARYSLIGALAGALGALAAALPDSSAALGLGRLDAIRLMFLAYAVLGALGGLAYARIAPRARMEKRPTAALGPSRGIVYKLAALFSIDSFAGGFVVQSLLALWLFERFDMSLAAASLYFFWSGVLSAFSFPVAAWIGSRIGLINTMVFTHIPRLPSNGHWACCWCAPRFPRWTCRRALLTSWQWSRRRSGRRQPALRPYRAASRRPQVLLWPAHYSLRATRYGRCCYAAA